MKLLDARRLTGLNPISDQAGAVIDVELDAGEDAGELIRSWQHHARKMLDAVGWGESQFAVRESRGGISLAFSAPVDALYTAVEIAEYAWQSAQYHLQQAPGQESDHSPPDFAATLKAIQASLADERNPDLLALERQAHERGVIFLSDDDEVSVGLGHRSQTWPVDRLPVGDSKSDGEIDWQAIGDIPVGLVTGVNGKTTTVRLASRIARTAGHTVGQSSTAGITVNDELVESGDYSGPGGARAVLRHQSVDVAVLEVARGGLLRRGLGTTRADAAVITNIAEDHLGDFGSMDLGELLDIKWTVMGALDHSGTAILNAEDDLLVERVRRSNLKAPICWFSVDPENPVLRQHCNSGGWGVTVQPQADGENAIGHLHGDQWQPLVAVNDAPITLQGTARHNIANALAAAALCSALGISDAAIADGLRSMRPNDNPGRCNFYDVDGVEVLIDFAHNPEAVAALFEVARQRPARRRILCFGQAGDRTDELISELARRAWDIGLDHVFISELPAYARGREPGEVPALLEKALRQAGAEADQITHSPDEPRSLEKALEFARPGDLVIMLALAESERLQKRLAAANA